MQAGTEDPGGDKRSLTPALKQGLRRIIAEQPDSRNSQAGGKARWSALLLPVTLIRWLVGALFRRSSIQTVELDLEEATSSYATIFPQPVRSPVDRGLLRKCILHPCVGRQHVLRLQAELEGCPQVVHIKGFVKGLNFDEGSRNEELLVRRSSHGGRLAPRNSHTILADAVSIPISIAGDNV